MIEHIGFIIGGLVWVIGIVAISSFPYLAYRKRRKCEHHWFNMRVYETGEYARICEKCYRLERHLDREQPNG